MMAIEKSGEVTAFYSAGNIDVYVVKDIVNTVRSVSLGLLDSINGPAPRVVFELIKFNNELGYQITFNTNSPITDHQLLLTKNIYNTLRNKYKISIVIIDESGKEFNFTNDNYRKAILKNNIFIYLLLPPVVMLTFAISHFLLDLLRSLFNSETLIGFISDNFIPLLGYPLSILAFGLKPMIFSTKVISYIIILLSAFAYYFITGNGLYGSLILLVIFILNSIKNSIS